MTPPSRLSPLGTVALVTSLVLAGFPSGVGAQERAAAAPGAGELIERTLAIVGGAVVTQSDVALARDLGLVEGAAAATPEATLAALVDRWLMLLEVARFTPAEPTAAAVQAKLTAVRARAGDEATLTLRLSQAGRSPSYLATWARDDLRIAAYLEQRFASAGAPAQADVAAYVEAHAAEFERAGLTGVEASDAARTRLVEERRRELIADWLVDLRRRTSVVSFPSGSP